MTPRLLQGDVKAHKIPVAYLRTRLAPLKGEGVYLMFVGSSKVPVGCFPRVTRFKIILLPRRTTYVVRAHTFSWNPAIEASDLGSYK